MTENQYNSQFDPAQVPKAGTTFEIDKKNTTPILLAELARAIKRIHALPPFRQELIQLLPLMVIAQFKGSALAEGLTYYAEIRKHYPWDDTDSVSGHNDLNPRNLIGDGSKIWVIDWDAAHQNDRYVDLAIAANFYVAGDEQESIFLKVYFGDCLTGYQSVHVSF